MDNLDGVDFEQLGAGALVEVKTQSRDYQIDMEVISN